MKYEELNEKSKKILEECKTLLKEWKLEKFNKKMQELTELQAQYIEERKNAD